MVVLTWLKTLYRVDLYSVMEKCLLEQQLVSVKSLRATNYVGLGVDAKVALDFHQARERLHPRWFRSQAGNKLWYTGLGATDIGNKKAIGGMSREFYANVFKYYNDPAKWQHQTREEYFAKKQHGNTGSEDTMWTFEPHVATEIYDAMLATVKDKVTVVFSERLDLKKGVVKDGARITKIIMESGREFTGKMFIDATYEGDLMAKAGVSYAVGREPNAQFGETINGVQKVKTIHHQFTKNVDPYVKPGDPKSGVLPGIDPGDIGEDESGDRKLQAYNFRMCTTDVPENRRDWEKPANYDEKWFELALRNVEAGDERISWAPTWMPNRKTDTNNNFAISTDFIGQNFDYPDADYETRAKIWKAHEDWQKGLMWTYAHHPRVPEKMRAAFQKLGLAKDEFKDNGNWPRQLYVREARRMIGGYVMSEKNCKRREIVEDSVGMGAYNMDSHNVQRYITKEGFVRNEGDIQIGTRPYPISYRSITPKAEECTNLLVPVCLSATHIAYGSIRMEPVFMILGQSAATAAVLALEGDLAVQDVPYAKLKEHLLKDGQILSYTGPKSARGLDPQKLEGVVVDDTQASQNGEWTESGSAKSFVGDGYAHDGNADKGAKSLTFRAKLPKAGRYELCLGFRPSKSQATNTPVLIKHAKGNTKLTVNQRKEVTPFNWVPLGEFEFKAGDAGFVEITNGGADGRVAVDGVRWVWLGASSVLSFSMKDLATGSCINEG